MEYKTIKVILTHDTEFYAIKMSADGHHTTSRFEVPKGLVPQRITKVELDEEERRVIYHVECGVTGEV